MIPVFAARIVPPEIEAEVGRRMMEENKYDAPLTRRERIVHLMADGEWRSTKDIGQAVGGTRASIHGLLTSLGYECRRSARGNTWRAA